MADDPYATHLPILAALSTFLPMRRVLEFGAGLHSTPLFLSLDDLEELVSVESDPHWQEQVATKDERHTVTPTRCSPQRFDFVLVDDGTCIDQRVQTIRFVLSSPGPVVAIHDAEVPDYAATIREFGLDSTLICLAKPHTAVVWPEGRKQNHELLEALK